MLKKEDIMFVHQCFAFLFVFMFISISSAGAGFRGLGSADDDFSEGAAASAVAVRATPNGTSDADDERGERECGIYSMPDEVILHIVSYLGAKSDLSEHPKDVYRLASTCCRFWHLLDGVPIHVGIGFFARLWLQETAGEHDGDVTSVVERARGIELEPALLIGKNITFDGGRLDVRSGALLNTTVIRPERLGMALDLVPLCVQAKRLTLTDFDLKPIHLHGQNGDKGLLSQLAACPDVTHLNLDRNKLNTRVALNMLQSTLKVRSDILPHLRSISVRRGRDGYQPLQSFGRLNPEWVADFTRQMQAVRPSFEVLIYGGIEEETPRR